MIGSNAIVAVNSGISLNFVGVREMRITNQEGTTKITIRQAVKGGKRVVTDTIAIIVIMEVRIIIGID